MIDYGYEDRLVDRIAVNEAIARLDPRQRRILLRYHRYGETLEEVGRREGVTRERIRSVLGKSYHRLRAPLIEQPKLSATKPAQTTRDTPPPSFDKAAFLRHMRLLIGLREQHAIWERQEEARRARERIERQREAERREFERERAELARLIAGETAKKAPPSPFVPDSAKAPPGSHFSHLPHLGDTLKIKLPDQYYVHSSPSYHPPPLPTKDELCVMAYEALDYLLATLPYEPPTGGKELGKWCTSVVFTRDGGEVKEAVNSIVRELPFHALLSAYPVPIEHGTLGAHATTPYASLRVTVTPDGMKLRFDVTWD